MLKGLVGNITWQDGFGIPVAATQVSEYLLPPTEILSREWSQWGAARCLQDD